MNKDSDRMICIFINRCGETSASRCPRSLNLWPKPATETEVPETTEVQVLPVIGATATDTEPPVLETTFTLNSVSSNSS